MTVSQLWPPVVQPRYLVSGRVWDSQTALAIPAVAKANTLLGIVGALNLQAWRGTTRLDTPQLLQQPDPEEPGATWYVQQHLTDWLISGNACAMVTARYAQTGQIAATRWFPAHLWAITQGPLGEDRQYWLAGTPVPRENVVHVKRGHHPNAWVRGIGIVEQHLRALTRVGMQEDAEQGALEGGGVPSVAVIAPQQSLSPEEIAQAGADWAEQFFGPTRVPAILPNGTQVIPLGWSAADSEMIEARKMSLIDVANIVGVDPYWLGSPGSSHTYKSPGPMFLTLLRTFFEPILSLFEDAWGAAWLPRGQQVRFDRDELTRDDLQTTVQTMVAATGGQPLLSVPEAREYMGRDPQGAPAPVAAAEAAPAITGGDDDANRN